MLIRVYLDNSRSISLDVPIEYETTCADVVEVCQKELEDDKKDAYYLAELCMGYERAIDNLERPYELLKQWGSHQDKVQFFLRCKSNMPDLAGHHLSGSSKKSLISNRLDVKELDQRSKLQNEAERQKHQIEQQCLDLSRKSKQLAALKELRTARANSLAEVNNKMNLIQKRIEEKSTKLKKLKELQELAERQKNKNKNLSLELETMKENFCQKEQILVNAITSVDRLTKELADLKQPENVGTSGQSSYKNKLMEQILEQNRLNQELGRQIRMKQDLVSSRQKQIDNVNDRINRMKERINSNQHEITEKNKQMSKTTDETVCSSISKQDSKYKSLPVKMPNVGQSKRDIFKSDENCNKIVNSGCTDGKPLLDNVKGNDKVNKNETNPDILQSNIPINVPTNEPNKNRKLLSHFTPRPYGFAKASAVPVFVPFNKNKEDQQEILITDPPAMPSKSKIPDPPAMPSKSKIPDPSVVPSKSKIPDPPAMHSKSKIPEMPVSHSPTKSKIPDPPTADFRQKLPVLQKLDWSSAPGEKNNSVNVAVKPKSGTMIPSSPSGYRIPLQTVEAKDTCQEINKQTLTEPPGNRKESDSSSLPSSKEFKSPSDSLHAVGSSYSQKSSNIDESRSSNVGSYPSSILSLDTTEISSQTIHKNSPASDSFNEPSSSLPNWSSTSSVRSQNIVTETRTVKEIDSLDSAMPPPAPPAVNKSPLKLTSGFQYAPKSVVADAFLKKLGSNAVHEHQQKMSQLYGNFDLVCKTPPQELTSDILCDPFSANEEMSSKVQPIVSDADPSITQKKSMTVEDKSVLDYTRTGSLPDSFVLCGSPTGESGIMHHKPTAPVPVRRRMSSGDLSEDHPNRRPKRWSNPIEISTMQHLQTEAAESAKFEVMSAENQMDQNTESISNRAEEVTSPFVRRGNLKRKGPSKLLRRVSFEPLALLLDAAIEGELDLVERTAREVPDVSAANDEGITALHNAICAGHLNIVKFLVEYGCDINAPDSDGWTPLHCAASCNNLPMVEFLVSHGACIFATTTSDQDLASDKCDEDEDGFELSSKYLSDIQEDMGFVNNCEVYAVYDYTAENDDELSFKSGDKLKVIRKGDDCEKEWWWSRLGNNEGYAPRNLLGLHPRVISKYDED